jgi:hypothetical protein
VSIGEPGRVASKFRKKACFGSLGLELPPVNTMSRIPLEPNLDPVLVDKAYKYMASICNAPILPLRCTDGFFSLPISVAMERVMLGQEGL